MRASTTRKLVGIFSIVFGTIGTAAAESEYDMFRDAPLMLTPTASTSQKTDPSCTPQQLLELMTTNKTHEGAHIGVLLPDLVAKANPHILSTQFQPSVQRIWLGNLKRYPLASDNSATSYIASEQTNGSAGDAIFTRCSDGSHHCIAESARSDWANTSRADGNVVTRGGVADSLPALEKRNVLFQAGKKLLPLLPRSSVAALTSDEQSIVERIARKYGWLGNALEQDAAQPAVLSALDTYNRLAGVDKNNAGYEKLANLNQQPWQHRSQEISWLGASVFGSPVQVIHTFADQKKPESAAQSVIWWSTTDGFLRAINAATGELQVAILPETVLDAVSIADPSEAGDVIAGLDTTWVALQHDENNDGKIRRTDGDYIYLYGGMRRGGSHVLAWDVTEPIKPALLFEITPQQKGFDALANTWSTPVLAKVQLPGKSQIQTVLVFGGGYDNRFDNPLDTSGMECKSSKILCGAAIYFVQASGREAGKLLWSVSAEATKSRHTHVDKMTDPVTAAIRSLDLDGDGITDYFYALDISGHVFRINMSVGQASKIAVELIADLHENPDSTIDNAFILPPGIAVLGLSPKSTEIALAIGSGTITQPFGSSNTGRLFVLHDVIAMTTPIESEVLTPDASRTRWLSSNGSGAASLVSDSSDATGNTASLTVLPPLSKGEKLMAAPTIVDNKAFFSTYMPPSLSTSCYTGASQQRLWAVDIKTGRPVLDAAGNINAQSPSAQYVTTMGGTRNSGNFASLALNNKLTLMGGTTIMGTSELSATPQKLRWQQLRSGPNVRP